MWENNLDIFTSTLIRLIGAALCGGLIGLERGQKRRAAGFRTHMLMLICIGGALTVMISQELYYAAVLDGSGFGSAVTSDVTRIAANVISGISFLGTGTILVTEHRRVRGLTTAAGLWGSACIGIAIGAGFYLGAVAACIYIIISSTLLARFEQKIISRSRIVSFHAEFSSVSDIPRLSSALRQLGIVISDIELMRDTNGTPLPGADISVCLPDDFGRTELIAAVYDHSSVRSVEEI